MRTVIAHGHIFKNAGTTLDWALQKNFQEDFCDHRNDDDMREGKAKYLEQYLHDHPNIKAISSHHLCDVSSIKSIRVIPLHLVRHPVARIISVYNFERQQKVETPGAIAAKEKTLLEYVQWRMQRNVGGTIRDYQSRYLAGLHNQTLKDLTQLDIATKLNEKLRNNLNIGLVERFDESMVIFEKNLTSIGINIDLSYIKQNVMSSNTSSIEDRANNALKQLEDLGINAVENNAIDLALYQYVSSKIQYLSLETGFNSRLKEFSSRCSKLNTIDNEAKKHITSTLY